MAKRSAQIKLSEHPRAKSSIAMAKSWGALLAFAVVGLASWRAGVAPFDVGLRALAAGVAGWVLGWFAAVQLWRHLAVAEVKARLRARDEMLEQRRAQAESENTMIVREGA